MTINAKQVERLFLGLLPDGIYQDEIDDTVDELRSCISFEEAGIMTTDRGFVMTFDGGTEFQVTIVQSR